MPEPFAELPPLDRDVPVPLYYQLAQRLRAALREAGEACAPLPTELELTARYGISRGVVRQALGLLEAEGLIVRERGRGTFPRRRLEHDPTRLCSVTDDLLARGWRPGARVLWIRRQPAMPVAARWLELGPDEDVWEIHRLRLADDEPVSLQWTWLPVRLAPDLDRHDLSGSLWRLFEERYDIRLASGTQQISVRVASPDEASQLGIAVGDPLFVVRRFVLDPAGRPVQVLDSLWRGDRYDFTVRLSR